MSVDPTQVVDDVASGVKAAITADPKPFYKSKTFWFNALALGSHYFGYLPPQIGIPVVAVTNLILRTVTSKPVTIS